MYVKINKFKTLPYDEFQNQFTLSSIKHNPIETDANANGLTSDYLDPFENARVLGLCTGPNNGDDAFNAGSPIAYRYRYDCVECKDYMANRCAKNWDRYCDVAFLNTKPSLPAASQLNTINMHKHGNIINGGIPQNQQLLNSAGQQRFCNVNTAAYSQSVPFDPTSAAPTKITKYYYREPLVCSLDANIRGEGVDYSDNDRVLNLMLDNASYHSDILDNMCVNTPNKRGRLLQYARSRGL